MSDQFHEIVGIIAGILALSGYIPYFIGIFRGKTKPNRATWFIWAIVGGLLAFSYIAEGDTHSIWLPLGYFFGPFITAILSIWYGYSTWTKLDTICMAAAILSIIPWILSQSAVFTLLINVLIDSTGAIPTIVKTYREPDTEDFTAWLIFFIANTIQLFAISDWNIASVYPIYLFILAGMIVFFIMKDKLKSRTHIQKEKS